MRIAFVSGNRERLPDAVVPLGLLYIHASVPDRHEKQLWDLCFERQAEEALVGHVERFRPELIALGMRNVQNNDYSGINDNLAYYARLISSVREVSQAPIVLGGGGFSVMPRELMLRLRPDFGVAGEGERALPQLVECLDAGETDFSGIGGLLWFEQGLEGPVISEDALRVNPPEPKFLDMNDLALPDRQQVDPRYYQFYGIESVQTKRGCPLRCDYCTYPTIEGRIGRTRDPHGIVDEMFEAVEKQPEINHFFFVDSVFNLPKRHAKEVCEALIARRWEVPWTCYANPLGFDGELAQLMARAGCKGMEIGSDSGSDPILKKLRKGFQTREIAAIHEAAQDAGILDCHTFILGTPGETLDHVHETLDLIAHMDPFATILQVWVDDMEALDPALRSKRTALRRGILELLDARRRDNPRWIIPPLGVNFDEKLFRHLRRRGFTGPLWQHLYLLDDL